MMIYRAKDGSFHRDAKSAGSGAIPFEFDNKTKDGVLKLLAAVAARSGPSAAEGDKPTPLPEERVQQAPPARSGGYWRVYHSREFTPGVFVAGCRADSPEEAVALVAQELVAREASR